MKPGFPLGVCIGYSILIVLKEVTKRQNLDARSKPLFFGVLMLNMVLSMLGLFFWEQNQYDQFGWTPVPTPHDYTRFAVLGVDSHDWFNIALVKLAISGAVALLLSVPLYWLNFALLRHYAIVEFRVRAKRITSAVVVVWMLAALAGAYLFVTAHTRRAALTERRPFNNTRFV